MTGRQGRVAVFGSGHPLAPSDDLYREALALGRLLAEEGFEVATGGYDGTMAAVSRGAHEAGGHVIGVTLTLFDPEPPNKWVSEEHRVGSFSDRLEAISADAVGYVALRGAIGTLTELCYVWGLLSTGVLPQQPCVLLGSVWRPWLDLLQREDFRFRAQHFALLELADTPEEAVRLLTR